MDWDKLKIFHAVAEAGINFDNPEYKESDILIGGFTGKKFSQDNTDAVTQLSASIGSYVSSMEQALEINIGGELFLDVGTTRGLRYGYVDGYDELGMYKYHKKDLDYKPLINRLNVSLPRRRDSEFYTFCYI